MGLIAPTHSLTKKNQKDKFRILVKKIKKSINSINEFWILNFLLVFFISLITAISYIFLRQNLEVHYSLLLTAFGILIISILSPIVFFKIFKFQNNLHYNSLYPIVSLLIFLLPVLGNFFEKIFYIYILLAIFILFNFKIFFKIKINFKQIAMLFILAFFVSIFLISSITAAGHINFFIPEQMNLGIMNHDTRFHIAITHIIQNFNITSLGTHGYLTLKLHVFVNWYFASFGNFLDLNPVWVVSGLPFFLMIPFFLFFLFNSSASLNNYTLKLEHIFLNLVFLIIIISLSGPFANSIFISETYLIALTSFLALIPAIFELKNRIRNKNNVSFFCLFLISLFPLLISMKVSVGIFYGIFISWIIFKSYGIKKITFFYGLIIFILFIISYQFFVPSTSDYVDTRQNPIDLFFYFKTFPGMYSFVSYFFVILLIMLSGYQKKKNSISNLIRINSDNIILIEGILIISFLGLIMALIGIPRNSSVWYFVNPCQWYAIPLIINYLLSNKENLNELKKVWKLFDNRKSIIKKTIYIFFIFIFLSFYLNTTLNIQVHKTLLKEIVVKANTYSNYSLSGQNETEGTYFKKNLKNFTLFDKNFLKINKNQLVINWKF